MKAYDLARKFVVAKTYSKADIEKRVNTFYMFAQLTQAEYEDLIQLINQMYD